MKFLLLPILSLYSFSIHAQNVGIGTTTPPYKLTVNTNGIGISQQSTSGLHEIGFFTNESGAYIQTHSPSPMKFAVGNGNAVMTLTTTGRLGIGVSLPTAKLEVNGDAKVNSMSVVDDLTVTGNITISGEGMVRSATSAHLK
ncbi:MAG: hypothetical protein H7Y31_09730 [Chitinophagaceae bacterium]|nr:hypothetical protein [Chitinophagaceae bacterium]